MNRSPRSNSPAAERRKTCEAKWTPPAQLLDLASDKEGLIAGMIDLSKTDTETHLQQMCAALATVDISKRWGDGRPE